MARAWNPSLQLPPSTIPSPEYILHTFLLTCIDSWSRQGTTVGIYAGRGQNEGIECLEMPIGSIQDNDLLEIIILYADYHEKKVNSLAFFFYLTNLE